MDRNFPHDILIIEKINTIITWITINLHLSCSIYNERLIKFIKASCLWIYTWKTFELDISLTSQFKFFPRICPHTRRLDKLAKSLILHGTAEMQLDNSSDYTIYMLGNWHIMGKICIHVTIYTSTTNLWKIQVIGIFGDNIPLFSRMFHSPLWSFCHDNIITYVSTDCQ